jgi:hypothetical protein
MKKIIQYLPDVIIIIGVGILSYNMFLPETSTFGFDFPLVDHHVGGKVLGVLLIATGIDIAMRRYLRSKKN